LETIATDVYSASRRAATICHSVKRPFLIGFFIQMNEPCFPKFTVRGVRASHLRTAVNAPLLNWLPWPVLKISGVSNLLMALFECVDAAR